MHINLIKRKNELIFADLKRGDAFYPVPDYEEDETDLYMVIDPVECEDDTFNSVELKDGTLVYFTANTLVRKCIATIGAEG